VRRRRRWGPRTPGGGLHGAFAYELDVERVGGSPRAAGVGDDLPDCEAAVHVAAEDGTDVVERARLENGLGPFADFLRGLEHDEHITGGGLSREE
jgi:hypothetical protein